ncbi:uncharacterized protein LOC142765631 isoform X1 [Rhipicephalus microplus]|uniref:uncharacterized protein LOC142765631 isoform X1 n=1 Tax=Rhipicephalus microplus TaxID=6941 RepID=UPI003F6DA09B
MANYLPHSPLPAIVRLHQKFTMANNGVHVVFPMGYAKPMCETVAKGFVNLAAYIFVYCSSADKPAGIAALGPRNAIVNTEMSNATGHYYNRATDASDYTIGSGGGTINAGDYIAVGVCFSNRSKQLAENYFNFENLAQVDFTFINEKISVGPYFDEDAFALVSAHIFEAFSGQSLSNSNTSFEDWLPGWIKLNPGSHFVCIGKYTGNDNISFKSPKKAVDNLGKPNKSPTLVTMNIQRTLTRFIFLTDYGKVLSVQTTDLLDAGDLNVPRFTSNFAMKHVVHETHLELVMGEQLTEALLPLVEQAVTNVAQ